MQLFFHNVQSCYKLLVENRIDSKPKINAFVFILRLFETARFNLYQIKQQLEYLRNELSRQLNLKLDEEQEEEGAQDRRQPKAPLGQVIQDSVAELLKKKFNNKGVKTARSYE